MDAIHARRNLELAALVRLGLGGALVGAEAPRPDEGVLEALVRRGALTPQRAATATAYVAQHTVSCPCGVPILAAEGTLGVACLQ